MKQQTNEQFTLSHMSLINKCRKLENILPGFIEMTYTKIESTLNDPSNYIQKWLNKGVPISRADAEIYIKKNHHRIIDDVSDYMTKPRKVGKTPSNILMKGWKRKTGKALSVKQLSAQLEAERAQLEAERAQREAERIWRDELVAGQVAKQVAKELAQQAKERAKKKAERRRRRAEKKKAKKNKDSEK